MKHKLVIFLILILALAVSIYAANQITSGNSRLSVWDDTDSVQKYSLCENYCGAKSKQFALANTYFYANYTNSSIAINSSMGNCSISFYTSSWSSWENMSFNSSSEMWGFNTTFRYKGLLNSSINCTSIYENLSIQEVISITNTVPYILKTPAGYIDFTDDGTKDTLYCTEDVLCSYNFSANVSEDDLNDVLVFNYSSSINTTLTNFSLNSSSGILMINVTHSNASGLRSIELNVKDTESTLISSILEVSINSSNDAPVFNGLSNFSFNYSVLFEPVINVSDEEENIPFVLNISFINCSIAQWSDRTDCNLFNSTYYSFNQTSGKLNISFTPSRNDVGSYIINFTVMDNSSIGNKTTEYIANFTVLNINSFPYFTYICDEERNATEGDRVNCWINVSDVDELRNLTISANYTWFKLNGTSNSFGETCNITTNYNASFFVNFSTADAEVGNWSVNISVYDTGYPMRLNASLIWFYIANVEDSVYLDEISNKTLYEGLTFYVNASDDDLLVTQKNLKNEALSFYSNTSWASVSSYSSSSNRTTARIVVDYDTAILYGNMNHTVRINVTDTAGNWAERNFTLSIYGDNAAVWDSEMETNLSYYEDQEIYLNLSKNVTDAEGDALTFSYQNLTYFPSFSITSLGVVNFTPRDADVGFHTVIINASDSKLNSLQYLNFTVYNVNDSLYIETPITLQNATRDISSNINATEDNNTVITLWIQDDDFKIPISQKSFYDENISINVSIAGPNPLLFNFSQDSGFPSSAFPNKTKYLAYFKANKSDVGSYNISINATDSMNLSYLISFNMTIFPVEHSPVLMDFLNYTSSVNRSFYLDINATDTEDVNESSGNLTYSYNFLSDGKTDDFINSNGSIFNSTSGVLSLTFNSSQGGRYHINISVNDSTNRFDYGDFWIFVYDSPTLTLPSLSTEFYLVENVSSILNFSVNHSAQDNLSFEFYVNGSLRYNLSYYGNNTNLSWDFTPNFTDETDSKTNLTLFLFNPAYPDLNATYNWNISINHSNSPVVFNGTISDKEAAYTSSVVINLSWYFSDIDYSDFRYNQTVNFTVYSNNSVSNISYNVSGWILTLTASRNVSERLNISARDYNGSDYLATAYSNNFVVNFIEPNETEVPTPEPTPTPSSGGGGGSASGTTSRPTPYYFKIIVPSKISIIGNETIRIPFKLENQGNSSFSQISLKAEGFKDGFLDDYVNLSLSKDYIEALGSKQSVEIVLEAKLNRQRIDRSELYEININATSKTPSYYDLAKVYVEIEKINISELEKLIFFTEEYIVENPQCIELSEMIKEAKNYFNEGDVDKARLTAEKALNSCRDYISQVSIPSKKKPSRDYLINGYLFIAVLVSFIGGIIFYYYSRIKMARGWSDGAVSQDLRISEDLSFKRGNNEA